MYVVRFGIKQWNSKKHFYNKNSKNKQENFRQARIFFMTIKGSDHIHVE